MSSETLLFITGVGSDDEAGMKLSEDDTGDEVCASVLSAADDVGNALNPPLSRPIRRDVAVLSGADVLPLASAPSTCNGSAGADENVAEPFLCMDLVPRRLTIGVDAGAPKPPTIQAGGVRSSSSSRSGPGLMSSTTGATGGCASSCLEEPKSPADCLVAGSTSPCVLAACAGTVCGCSMLAPQPITNFTNSSSNSTADRAR